MTEEATNVCRLLDLACSTADDSIRVRAIERIVARCEPRSRRPPGGVRGTSLAVERLLDRFARFGVPAQPRILRPASVRLARALLALDDARLDRLELDLGLVEAAVLVRSLDRPAAADVARALSTLRDRLDAATALAPCLGEPGVRESARRFAALAPRGFAGGALVRALGRSLAAHLISGAEPDTVATLRRRLPRIGDSDAQVDEAWFPVATQLALGNSASATGGIAR